MINKQKIEDLLTIIKNITSKYVIQNSNAFFDEPPFFFYSGLIKNSKKNYYRSLGYQIFNGNIVGGGSSYNNKELAILKCEAELIERFCMFCFLEKDILFKNSASISVDKFLHPKFYKNEVRDSNMGWVKATELILEKPWYIPAQLIYLNYYKWAKKNKIGEYEFVQHISNGGSFGFLKEETILRGIYELIERDSVLTVYLSKIKTPRIDISSIDNPAIKKFHDLAKQYNFEIILLESTNDLEVPTYISIALDKSGLPPNITVGVDADINEEDAILGSLEESFMGRTWVRHELMIRNNQLPKIQPNKIRTRLERAFYFSDKKNVQKLDYLIDQLPKPFKRRKKIKFKSEKEELSNLLTFLKKKNMRVFAIDIKPLFLQKYPFCVYKIIMPELQYLYLDETTNKIINWDRIAQVNEFFSCKKPEKINTVPHFLL